MSSPEEDAARRLKAKRGNYYLAVSTAVRGLARAQAHADWLRKLRCEMTDPEVRPSEESVQDAQQKAHDLATTISILVLDSPDDTFTPAQRSAARRTLVTR